MGALAAHRAGAALVDFPSLDPVHMMDADHVLPAVSRLMQRRYLDSFRAYRATASRSLLKRRSNKRKPSPGVYDVADDEAG